MKKVLLLIFLISVSVLCVIAQTKSNKPAPKVPSVSDGIKSKTTYQFKYSSGERKKDSSLVYVKRFDEKGRMTEDSGQSGKITYEYNDKGKLILETSFDASGNIHYRDEYSYDGNGCLIQKKEYEGNKILFSIKSAYNIQKLETERIVSDSAGRMQMKYSFAYDDHGNKAEEIQYDSALIQVAKRSMKFNEKGKLISLSITGRDTTPAKYIYEYNEAGLKSKTLCYHSDGSMNYKTVYEYDAKKHLINEVTYQSAGAVRNVYQYNAKGNKTSEISYDGSGNVIEKTIFRYTDQNILSEEIEYDLYDEPSTSIKYFYEKFLLKK